MFSYSPIVSKFVLHCNSLGISSYEGFNPSPLNYTPKNPPESIQYQYVEDAWIKWIKRLGGAA
jgi:hypothetical protein